MRAAAHQCGTFHVTAALLSLLCGTDKATRTDPRYRVQRQLDTCRCGRGNHLGVDQCTGPHTRSPRARRARLRQPHQTAVPNLERELRKLKQAFLAEQLSAAAYEQQRTALLTSTVNMPAQADDPEALVSLLRDLPLLLTHTTSAERRTILQQLITEVYARQKAVVAFRPTRLAERLFQAAAETPAWRDVLTNSGDGGPGGHLCCATMTI